MERAQNPRLSLFLFFGRRVWVAAVAEYPHGCYYTRPRKTEVSMMDAQNVREVVIRALLAEGYGAEASGEEDIIILLDGRPIAAILKNPYHPERWMITGDVWRAQHGLRRVADDLVEAGHRELAEAILEELVGVKPYPQIRRRA